MDTRLRAVNVGANMEGAVENGKPVDHPSKETVDLRQGTGPRATVSVLFISLVLAVVVGVLVIAYFYLFGPTTAPRV
jgi:hypothetical protein